MRLQPLGVSLRFLRPFARRWPDTPQPLGVLSLSQNNIPLSRKFDEALESGQRGTADYTDGRGKAGGWRRSHDEGYERLVRDSANTTIPFTKTHRRKYIHEVHEDPLRSFKINSNILLSRDFHHRAHRGTERRMI